MLQRKVKVLDGPFVEHGVATWIPTVRAPCVSELDPDEYNVANKFRIGEAIQDFRDVPVGVCVTVRLTDRSVEVTVGEIIP